MVPSLQRPIQAFLNIDSAKPKSGACIFFSCTSQGHNALPRPGLEPGLSDLEPSALTTGLLDKAVALVCLWYSWPRMLKVAPCMVVQLYIQIFSAWWVTTILYNYRAMLCELRYKSWILTFDYFESLVKSSTPWEKENLRMAGILTCHWKQGIIHQTGVKYLISLFSDKWIFQEIWNTGQYSKCVSCHCDSRKCQRKGLHKFHTWYLHLLVFKTLLHQIVIYFLTVILVLRIHHTSE